MLTIQLDGIEAAALDVVAKAEGITPEQFIRDLIRDAAIFLVTGQQRRTPHSVKLFKKEIPQNVTTN